MTSFRLFNKPVATGRTPFYLSHPGALAFYLSAILQHSELRPKSNLSDTFHLFQVH